MALMSELFAHSCSSNDQINASSLRYVLQKATVQRFSLDVSQATRANLEVLAPWVKNCYYSELTCSITGECSSSGLEKYEFEKLSRKCHASPRSCFLQRNVSSLLSHFLNTYYNLVWNGNFKLTSLRFSQYLVRKQK